MLERLVTAVMLVALVAVSGCTGGGDTGDPSPTPSTSSSWRAGDHRPGELPDLCAGISRTTLIRLGIRENVEGSNGDCRWHETDGGATFDTTHDLNVEYQAYEPDDGRSAADQAKAAFAKLPDQERTEGTPSMPIRGFGDQAKVFRRLSLLGIPAKDEVSGLVVRRNNLVAVVWAKLESDLSRGSGRLGSIDGLEATIIRATREVLAELGKAETTVPSASGYRAGEVKKVHRTCPSNAARRAAPGARHWELTSSTSTLVGGCTWEYQADFSPELDVMVEAIAPSRTTEKSATTTAKELYRGMAEKKTKKGLGDEASIDVSRFTFKGDRSVSVDLVVRDGNLLVAIDYERWSDPSAKAMEKQATQIARDVLDAY